MKRYLLLSAILAGVMLPGMAQAQFAAVGHYTSGPDTSFDIGTFTQKGDKVALVGVSHKASITFKKGPEWNAFVALWRKAKKTHSKSLKVIGSLKEIGSAAPSSLTVAVGPGVQFTINDKPGAFSFILLPSNFASFDAAIAKVTASLASTPVMARH